MGFIERGFTGLGFFITYTILTQTVVLYTHKNTHLNFEFRRQTP